MYTDDSQRRRTQIRKAQRAYRQRKESTLEELRKRVTDLSNVMELMNKAFVDCSDRLAGSGLSAEQASHIRDTEMQFGALMRCVRNYEEGCPIELAGPVRRSSNLSHSRTDDALQPRNVPSWMDESVLVAARHGNVQRDLIGIGKRNRKQTVWHDKGPLCTASQVSFCICLQNIADCLPLWSQGMDLSWTTRHPQHRYQARRLLSNPVPLDSVRSPNCGLVLLFRPA